MGRLLDNITKLFEGSGGEELRKGRGSIGGKLPKAQADNLMEWGIAYRSDVGIVTVEAVAKQLESLGITRDRRTMYRYKKKIDTAFEKLPAVEEINSSMISIPVLAKTWGCSRNFIWQRCKSGEIPATQIGDRWFIPMWWVKEKEKR